MSSASSSLEQGMTNASITGEQKEESNPVATSTSTTTAADSTAPTSANDSNPDTASDNNNIDSSSSDDTSTTSSGGDDDDNDDDDDDDDDNNDTPMSTSDNNEDDVDPMTLITKAITHKEDGNNQFKNKEFTKASRSYKKGVNTMKQLLKKSDTDPNDEQIKSLRLSLQSNLCMVYYKLEKYKNCTEIADYILTNLDSKNSKAYYRRGLSNYKLKKISNAKHDLYQALQYNPKDKSIIKEYRMVKKEYDTKISKQKKDKEKQKKALAKAFSSGGDNGNGESSLYDDKEEELKKKRLKAEEERLEKEKLKEKRKADWEEDCVKRLSENVEILPFEEYDKFMTEMEEKEKKSSKKAKKEQEEAEHRRRQKEIEEKNRKKRENAKKNKSDDEEGSDDDILTESELKQLRGYKKTSDGRTTSYFSREQTEHEKKLLGSIAPKKLEPVTVSATNQPSSISATKTNVPLRSDSAMSSSSASAWNQAGTWEEKDTSSWCNKTLEKFLKDTNATYESESISFDAYVKKVKNLTGDASVANVSGKKRFIFDYSTDLTYEISMKSSTDMDVDTDEEKNDVIAKGSLHLPDISSTSISDEEIDVQVMAWKKNPKDVYRVNATKCREVLVEKIREQVFAFVRAFNSQY